MASADAARRFITAFICWKRTAHAFALPSRSTAWLDRISWPLLAAPTHAVLIQSVTLLICMQSITLGENRALQAMLPFPNDYLSSAL